MALTLEQVQRIAELARIELRPDEAERMRVELNNIFGFIEQLQAQDTRGVEPMAHALGYTQLLRVDVVTDTDQREFFQKSAPAAEEGLYLVPKVVE